MTYAEAEAAMLAGSVVCRPTWPLDDFMSSRDGYLERASGLSLSAEDFDATDWLVIR